MRRLLEMIGRPGRFGIAALIVLADRLTKLWIEHNVGAFDTIAIIPGVFHIVHAENTGAAFGVLANAGASVRALVLIGLSLAVLLFLAVQLWRLPSPGWPPGNAVAVALGLVVGGAAGNLIDRLWRGSVTDFLQVFLGSYEWPSFNVADSAISVGGCLLLLAWWRSSREPRTA